MEDIGYLKLKRFGGIEEYPLEVATVAFIKNDEFYENELYFRFFCSGNTISVALRDTDEKPQSKGYITGHILIPDVVLNAELAGKKFLLAEGSDSLKDLKRIEKKREGIERKAKSMISGYKKDKSTYTFSELLVKLGYHERPQKRTVFEYDDLYLVLDNIEIDIIEKDADRFFIKISATPKNDATDNKLPETVLEVGGWFNFIKDLKLDSYNDYYY